MDTMPELLAKVRLHKKREVYLIVDTNLERRVVEVISVTGGAQHLIADVPIASIQELVEPPPYYL